MCVDARIEIAVILINPKSNKEAWITVARGNLEYFARTLAISQLKFMTKRKLHSHSVYSAANSEQENRIDHGEDVG